MSTRGFIRNVLVFFAVLSVGQGGSAVAVAAPAAVTSNSILYVKSGVVGDCAAWITACDLQAALLIAAQGDQLWVAAGTYKPTTTTNRRISFILKSGVAIYGGFPAGGGDWNSRSWRTNLSTLSGDIGIAGVNSDNSYHVVTIDGVDSTAVLDGFTITGGNADLDNQHDAGGGMLNENASPRLENLTFFANSAVYGGGMFNATSSPTLTDVTFSGNFSSYGGGMTNFSSSPTLVRVTFYNNESDDYAGGMDNYDSSPVLINVTFSANSAVTGGGMFNTEGSNPSLTNVTFSGNSAGSGGGIYNWYSSPQVTNAILWGNTPDQIVNGGSSTPVVTNSDIQGGYPGTGNINVNPLLGALADNGGSTQTHALPAGSSAIDVGATSVCPAADQRSFLRPIDGNADGSPVCDMGSYEYGSYFTLSVYLPFLVK